MVYHGTIRNGKVIVESDAPLPEGAHVRIDVEAKADLKPAQTAAQPPEFAKFWSELRAMAGTAQHLPPDIAMKPFSKGLSI